VAVQAKLECPEETIFVRERALRYYGKDMEQLGIPLAKYFPLRETPLTLLDDLCRSLWGWENCHDCLNTGVRSQGRCPSCPWSARPLLGPFREFYQAMTYRHTPEDWFKSPPAVQSHIDLLSIAAFIQKHPQTPRQDLVAMYSRRSRIPGLTDANKSQAFDFALSILSMVPFAEGELSLDDHSICVPETWLEHQSAHEALESALPIGRCLTKVERRMVSQHLSVAKLRSHGLEVLKTDDFRQHLDYDPAIPGVYVFHHHGFLRGHMSSVRSSGCADNRSVKHRS
jgi:hypothetical protein